MQENHKSIQPLVAWRALRRLMANPQETHEVFNVIRALSGPALENGYRRFVQTAHGRKVLREDIELRNTLNNRDYLASLLADSLGRHYLNFVISEHLSADGLAHASDESEAENMEPGLVRFRNRQRDMHDIWHTLTEYGRDELGEVCLLAFTYAQTNNRGLGVICLVGCAKLAQHYGYGKGAYAATHNAYQAGKHAAWLPGQNWEYLLTRPINEVRTCLGIAKPERYVHLRDMQNLFT